MVLVSNAGPRLRLANGVKLEPGLNEVAKAAWKECLLNKMTQVFLESRMIRVVSGVVGEPTSESLTMPAEPDAPVDPEPMLARDLIAAIKETEDPGYLQGLLAHDERRTTVIIAINARLETLKKAADADDSED